MIKDNELRIGNFVEKEYIKNLDLSNDVSEMEITDFIYNHFEQIIPIPLTEEWLLKFGFEREGEKAYWVLPYLKIHSIPTIDGGEILMMPNNRYAYQIKHVHSLQNLYFALTNEELKIKDNQQKKQIEV